MAASVVMREDVEQVMWNRTFRQVMTAAMFESKRTTLGVTMLLDVVNRALGGANAVNVNKDTNDNTNAAKRVEQLANAFPAHLRNKLFPKGAVIVDADGPIDAIRSFSSRLAKLK